MASPPRKGKRYNSRFQNEWFKEFDFLTNSDRADVWPLLCQNANVYIVMLYIFLKAISYEIIIITIIIIYNIYIANYLIKIILSAWHDNNKRYNPIENRL